MNMRANTTTGLLNEACAQLRSLPPHCEPEFLRIGEQLGLAITAIGKVQERMNGLSSHLTGNDLASARRVLENSMAELVALVEGKGNGRQSLTALHDLIAKALLRLEPLSRVIGEIGVLAVNARIQASQLSQGGVDFSVFTREISRLRSLAGEAVERSKTSLTGLLATIDTAQASFDSFEREHAASLGEVRKRLGESLQQLHQHDRQMAKLVEGLNGRSREIAAGIGAAIGALQINDITMQRTGHVDEALTILAELEAGTRREEVLVGREHLIMAAACRLQAMQLTQASVDFKHEVMRVIEQLNHLAASTQALAGDARATLAGDNGNNSCVGIVERDCGRALTFLEAFHAADSQVKQAINDVSAGVRAMAGDIEAIHSIEIDMRIMGLNATLKCGRLGKEGRTLAVIAQELRAYSKKTGEDSQIVFRLLSEASAMGETLTQEEHGGGIEDIESGMRQALAILSELGRDLSDSLDHVGRDGAAALSALTTTAQGIHLHESVPALVTRVADDLEALADRLDPERHGNAQVEQEMRELLNQKYTMESERLIHALFADGQEVQAGKPAAATVDVEEFFF